MALVACRNVGKSNPTVTVRNQIACYQRSSFNVAGKMHYSSGSASDQRPRGQTVVTEKIGPVITVGINRPEVRNAMNQETAQRLTEELSAFDQDDTLSVAVLHGIGGNFCAGYDLKELSQGSASLMLEWHYPRSCSDGKRRCLTLDSVSGYAVAGGLELALLADLRVLEESAIMGVFCHRFGVPLIDGGTVRLPQLIGLSRALDLILTGRPIGAQEALAFGVANRVVPTGQALQRAIELAEQISSFPQLCLRADRNSAYNATFDSTSFNQAMQYETDHGLPIIPTESVTQRTSLAVVLVEAGSFFK
uniref:Enoyl CoA hydratase domain containing 2 n=1 Tax=Electrophorus electricus TaxID=8005 RepID=A0A4W4H1M8_ELEEL